MRIIGLLLGLWSAAALAQYRAMDLIPLPADSSSASFDLKQLTQISPKATINVLPLLDQKGAYLRPQPDVKATIISNVIHLDLTGIYFWGTVQMPIQLVSGSLTTYSLHRGPGIQSNEVLAPFNKSAEVWLYNYEARPLTLSWRLTSRLESVCGKTEGGNPKENCTKLSDLGRITIPPISSKALAMKLPLRWFDGTEVVKAKLQDAQLELFFSTDDNAAPLPIPLKLKLDAGLRDWPDITNYMLYEYLSQLAARFLPASFPREVGKLLFVMFWVALGAAMLMLIQIIIPGFRRCLQIENQLDLVQDKFSSVGNRVGGRLYSRCNKDLASIRSALFMKDPSLWVSGRLWRRLALFTNSIELSRVEAMTNAVDARIQLTGKLDELRLEQEADPTNALPISLRWRRDAQIRMVETILTRGFISDTEFRKATQELNSASNLDELREKFPDKLDARIARICKEFQCHPWAAKKPLYVAGFPTLMQICDNACTPPADGWSDEALFQRDLDVIRLELIYRIIALETNEGLDELHRDRLLNLLHSADIKRIDEARNLIEQISEGIFELDIRKAFLSRQWDFWYSPDLPTAQEVLNVCLRFRDDRLNRAAARDRFQCFWGISNLDSSGGPPADSEKSDGLVGENYESGWSILLMPQSGVLLLTPQVYQDGVLLEVSPNEKVSPENLRSPLKISVSWQNGTRAGARLLRGGVDALVTAIVPVITVAVAQAQSNAVNLDWTTLVSLGFTSQAIRAAIVPESMPRVVTPAATAAAGTATGDSGGAASKP